MAAGDGAMRDLATRVMVMVMGINPIIPSIWRHDSMKASH